MTRQPCPTESHLLESVTRAGGSSEGVPNTRWHFSPHTSKSSADPPANLLGRLQTVRRRW